MRRPAARACRLFLVPKFLVNADGSLGARNDVRAHSVEHKLGIHASPTCTMVYGDRGGAIGYLVGEENRGLACMFTMMNLARLAVGLQGVGIAETATQAALAYARERKQGRAMGSRDGSSAIIAHPDVKRMLLTMRALTRAARVICFATAGAIDAAEHAENETARKAAHERASLLTPVAKAFSTDIGIEVASLGIQVHGGMGYIEETGAAQHYRDARIAAIYEGTNGIQAVDLVARKLPQSGGAAVGAYLDELRRMVKVRAGGERSGVRQHRRAALRGGGESRSRHHVAARAARQAAGGGAGGCDAVFAAVRKCGRRLHAGGGSAGGFAACEWRRVGADFDRAVLRGESFGAGGQPRARGGRGRGQRERFGCGAAGLISRSLHSNLRSIAPSPRPFFPPPLEGEGRRASEASEAVCGWGELAAKLTPHPPASLRSTLARPSPPAERVRGEAITPLPAFFRRRTQIGLGRSGNRNSPVSGKPEIGAPVFQVRRPTIRPIRARGTPESRRTHGPRHLATPGISGSMRPQVRRFSGVPRAVFVGLLRVAPAGVCTFPAAYARQSGQAGWHGLSRRAGCTSGTPNAATAPRPARRDDRETPLWLGRDECKGDIGRVPGRGSCRPEDSCRARYPLAPAYDPRGECTARCPTFQHVGGAQRPGTHQEPFGGIWVASFAIAPYH